MGLTARQATGRYPRGVYRGIVTRVRVVVTTALDVLALLLVAAGFALALWPVVGGLALGVAGAVIALGSALADPKPKPDRKAGQP